MHGSKKVSVAICLRLNLGLTGLQGCFSFLFYIFLYFFHLIKVNVLLHMLAVFDDWWNIPCRSLKIYKKIDFNTALRHGSWERKEYSVIVNAQFSVCWHDLSISIYLMYKDIIQHNGITSILYNGNLICKVWYMHKITQTPGVNLRGSVWIACDVISLEAKGSIYKLKTVTS